MDILSFQSRVAWGYVGNAIAVPTIQHFGINAWPIDTVVLGHHPGHGPTFRRTPNDEEISAQSSEVLERMTSPGMALIGYLGSAKQGDAIKATIDRARDSNKITHVYLDPVFGDTAEGIYVDRDIVTYFNDVALPMADIVMPNCFELANLASTSIESTHQAIDAARVVIARGPEIVLVSSVPFDEHSIQNLLITKTHAWSARTPLLPLKAKGTGDMLSAAFTALHASGTPFIDAFQYAVSLVQSAVEDASERNLIELDLPRILAENTQKIDDVRIEEIST